MIYAMKRLFIIAGCTLLCTLCGAFTTEAFAQSANQKDLKSYNQEQRAQRRAQRLSDMEKYIDSIVLSRNFEFNPQTIQQQPAGTMQFITNTVYTVTLWRGSLDVCLPYYAGYVPPYKYVLLNTGVPNVSNYTEQKTEQGWMVSFKANLYATAIDYTFTFEIDARYGSATLTISNTWYSPVQYTGTITRIY